METYLYEWLNFVVRFLHLITGIAWIGASFYFVWLDNSLREPPQWKKDKGIKGDLWAIHGGGFYEVAKYSLGPEQMPKTLHWFKWEAYTTGITGFILLTLLYYIGASSYTIDPAKMALTPWQASLIGIGAIAIFIAAYEVLCRTALVEKSLQFGLVVLAILTVLAFGLDQLISSRAMYIHIGAMIGLAMVFNVFTTIMPSQRKMVEAISQGQQPDPSWGHKAKLRSVHNNYATLPVILIMISNHYPITYSHSYGWLILSALIAITAYARHFFNLKHHDIIKPSILIGALIAFATLIWLFAPKAVKTEDKTVTTAQIMPIIQSRCLQCHAAKPTDDVFKFAQGGIMYDTEAEVLAKAERIHARAVVSKDMPFINKTQMTDEERQLIAQWYQGLKK
ncbi:urate hydroxylase PuuD [Thiofilum flexile]|uniref:urate hydroxylase PuuD n=1 Tax=Thiofilum flexile TaxID=125627 RepID=UPI000378EA8E|nr:urate hydroxylase PuuD [Thiofilum flexile]